MKDAIETTVNFCAEKWIKYSLEHICYMDKGHEGNHICGLCDNEEEHERV